MNAFLILAVFIIGGYYEYKRRENGGKNPLPRNTRIVLILIAIILAGIFVWKAIQTKSEKSIPQAVVSDSTSNVQSTSTTSGKVRPVDNENVAISFKGFGPGKVHNGTFGKITSNLMLVETGGMKGDVVVDVGSLTTDTDGVTNHLKTNAFFDVAKYPTAKFVLNSLKDGKVTGSLTMHGVTKSITFPVTYSEKDMKYTSTFTLNMKDFAINQAFANETIEINIVVPLL